MTIERLLGRLLPILPIVWILLIPKTGKAQAPIVDAGVPIVDAPSQFGSRPSVFTGYGPGFGYCPGVGYGYGFSPRFAPIPNPRYGYGPRLSLGFGLGYFSPLGVGPQFGYGPQYGYLARSYGSGYGWYYPAAFGSFWSNGLSLYGPPVPTFGVTPGSFGGSDAHRNYFLQSYYSMDWDSYRYKSQMPYGWEPSAKWNGDCRICAPIVVTLPAASALDKARFAVRVPHPDAELWIGSTKLKPSGMDRSFETPALESGKNYDYEFIARWTDERGERRAESRTVTVKGGDSVDVNFRVEK